jgi:cell division protein FtsW
MGMLRDYLARRFAGRTDGTPAPTPAPAATPRPRAIGAPDPVLLGIVLALIASGVVMVFSASAVFASQRFGDGHFYLVRQGIFAAIAIPLMLIASRVDYHRFVRPLTYPVLGLSVLLLLYVALGFGHSAGGAARWISVGPVHVQPAEMAKLAMILWLAYSLSKKQEAIRTFKIGILPHLIVMGVLALLCLRQPDFGSAAMICVLTFVLLFAAGAKVGPIALLVTAAASVASILVWSSPYRMRRVEAFLDPFGHRQDAGYQIAESLIAIGSGVAMGLLPTKGLVLPFMSYGGSALLVNAVAMGILLNVSRPREGDEERMAAEADGAERAVTGRSNGRASAPPRISGGHVRGDIQQGSAA